MSVIVKDLTKVYDDRAVVNNVSFEARSGEILGFLGPNGAGKTTTMKMICCYTQPTSGQIIVDGFDTSIDPLSARKHIGYLPEHNPLYEEMYVKEFLQFIASIHRIDNKAKRIAEVIGMTGLEKEQNKIIGTLSKGYRQRVGLAQAIIHDAKVLILDEPTSGLDMNQLVDIRQLIKNLGKDKTVIFSSHIMQEVQALCDRVVIVNDGQLVADESIDVLSVRMSGSQQVFVRFEEGKTDIEPYKKLNGVTSITFDQGLYIFSTQEGRDVRADIFHTAVQHNQVIIELRQEKANIEEIFRKLTKAEKYV
ncbi:MAG TPA: ATP-binding cassette domain-containing protein [Saprospiraceae bacterium]|nr:ATP-binding cassette domain-containing protein [Saprospiraceae bacterium]HRO08784.1 ATP-binding cassette domain-containing protein [Saprospiraceae bacterium]HRP41649.1 ATP-binding cassette domain-containing protein [Saprospiraceae bacterium]